ncbi:MAG: glutamate--tRNA ligase [Candidatus Sungbacteria bacterium RIFCSPLOWO2_02_FULL_47_9]|nr:MAG: glutamate--tRNA ligase [Candidatus Sungbacteria bacterium RIFCSPLOWO2_02_FULL_47_9]
MKSSAKPVRVRIAPSPSGNLHVGTARAALFNYLFAKHNDGTFVVRIEDTDTGRSTKEFEKNILDGLHWLGIDWDEGPELQGTRYLGNHGPYRQTGRREIYKKYLVQLLNEGKVFACFCEKNKEERKESSPRHAADLHSCPDRDHAYTLAGSRPFVIRYKNSEFLEYYARKQETIKHPAELGVAVDRAIYQGALIQFNDIVRDKLEYPQGHLMDFIIAKSLHEPLYNFAVVVDDHEMKITHVIRGEDHIPNTPKQILLIEALGFSRPEYAHLPLILGPDRSKLSKRHGATSVDEYQGQGYLPEALFNFTALLGWNPGGEQEIFPKSELIKLFSLEKVQKGGAIFDTKKLDWMNGEYIRKKSIDELASLCIPFLEHAGTANPGEHVRNPECLKKIMALEQPRLKKLSEIGERTDYFFKEPEYDRELLKWKTMSEEEMAGTFDTLIHILSDVTLPQSKEKLEERFLLEIGTGDKGRILWPLRVALSGEKFSPGPFEILEILGREQALRRVNRAREIYMQKV